MKLDINDRARMIIETGLMCAISGGAIWYESRGINLSGPALRPPGVAHWIATPLPLARQIEPTATSG
jgi:hypothetical protein